MNSCRKKQRAKEGALDDLREQRNLTSEYIVSSCFLILKKTLVGDKYFDPELSLNF